jgi:hypothetical protein
MDSDLNLKMAILKEIAEDNSNQQYIAAVVNSIHDRVTAERKTFVKLDKISKISKLVSKKSIMVIKTSITSEKLTDSFLTKRFDCLEW